MEFAARIAIPAAVFIVMWIVGLELTAADFQRLLRQPKAAVWGILGQLTVFPLLAGALIVLVRPDPVVTAGLVLIAAAPSGAISNLLTVFARGNVALSVSLTAVSKVIGVVTYPFVAAWGLSFFLDQQVGVTIPVGRMMVQLTVLMLVPVAIGMLVRHRHQDFVNKRRTSLQRLSVVLVVSIVAFIIVDQRVFFAERFLAIAALAALLTLVVMGAGWGLGRTIRASQADTSAFMMEFAARNTAIAIVVAANTLGRIDYAAFIVAYFVAQMMTMLVVIAVLRTVPRLAGAESSGGGRQS